MLVPVPKSKTRAQVARVETLTQAETVKSLSVETTPEGNVPYWLEADAKVRPLLIRPAVQAGAPMRPARHEPPTEAELDATVPELSSRRRLI